jgi:proline iminopeptidase
MPERFPAIEPYNAGMLDVGDGQRIYWEASGNPEGKPAVALHGGPGSGGTPRRRRSFDPDAYRFVQFDQRGCGRSTPSVADLSTSLDTNTTGHLIGDIEKLREHLGIGRWLVWGVSWGVTLGLAYAQRYPERVTELVLVSCTMTRPSDVHWLYHEAGRFFPEQWHPVPGRRRERGRPGRRLRSVAQCRSRSRGPGPRSAELVRLGRRGQLPGGGLDAEREIRRSPLPDDLRSTVRALLLARGLAAGRAAAARRPPAGRHPRRDDPRPVRHSGTTDVPWLLHQAWPGSELHLVRTGHQGGDEMTGHMMTALNRFART